MEHMDIFISVFTKSGSAQPMEEAIKIVYRRDTDGRVPSELSLGEDKPVNNHSCVISIDRLFSEAVCSRIDFSVFCILCPSPTFSCLPFRLVYMYLSFLMLSNKLLQI